MSNELTCYDKTTCRFAEEVRELRAALDEAQHNAAFAVGENERLIKAAGAETADGAIATIEAQRAALERARALETKLRDRGKAPHLYSENERVMFIVMADELAAALSSGGAA